MRTALGRVAVALGLAVGACALVALAFTLFFDHAFVTAFAWAMIVAAVVIAVTGGSTAQLAESNTERLFAGSPARLRQDDRGIGGLTGLGVFLFVAVPIGTAGLLLLG